MFFDVNIFHLKKDGSVTTDLIPERLRGDVAAFDIRDKKKVIVEAGRRITARHIRQLEESKINSWKRLLNIFWGVPPPRISLIRKVVRY